MPDYLFVLLVMRIGTDARNECHYISNGKVDYVIRQLEDYIAALKLRQQPGAAGPQVEGNA
jgi:hypothetical protein